MKSFKWSILSVDEKIEVLKRPVIKNQEMLVEKTKKIIELVRAQKDKALIELTNQYDNVLLDGIKVKEEDIKDALRNINPNVKKAIEKSAENISLFHRAIKPIDKKIQIGAGIVCEQVRRAIPAVGLYVPGGTAPLVSTVLMLGVPSKIAECATRIICTPPSADGTVDPNILYAASLCGITQIYKVGGAQAIAAMAYGTESIPKVNKIYGPGNSWVTQAKMLVSQDPMGAAYDLPAGPSELMIIADKEANPVFIAADLLSQAEHGVDSQVIFVTNDEALIIEVQAELKKQSFGMPRENIIKASLENGRCILVDSLEDAVSLSNQYAPEHLILQIEQPREWVSKISCAGSVFLGRWSPESAGDYASGTNHVLPTYGCASSYSGLSVDDFMTKISIQELSKSGLGSIREAIEQLADIEGLYAHKRAVSIRFEVGGES